MNFDVPEFKKRLDAERAKGMEPAQIIQQEVRKAEEMKEGISEENDHATEFVSEAINRIDTYIFQLHEIARQFNPSDFDLDQQTYLKDTSVHHRIGDRIERLKEQGDANASTEDPLIREGEEKQ